MSDPKHVSFNSRLTEVEGKVTTFDKVVPALINQSRDLAIQTIDNKLHPLFDAVNAIIDIVGEETVKAKIVEINNKKIDESLANSKAEIQKMLTDGIVAKADKVSEKSIILASETKGGNSPYPGEGIAVFNKIPPFFQQKLIGQASGSTVQLAEDHTYLIKEVWDFVEVKATAELPAPATEVIEQPVAAQ